MSSTLISMVMNGVIIVLLLATILYSARLSRNIARFRDSRKELEQLVTELGKQIIRADEAVSGMRNSARDAGEKLQGKISDGRALRDELEVINQAAANMATRLEKAVDRSSGRSELAATKPSAKPAAPVPVAAQPKRGLGLKKPKRPENTEPQQNLGSQAERELYDALRSRKPGAGDQT